MGEGLAARGDVVLVAMNYRLNAFGWLTLPELDTIDPRGVSSNRGLLDIQEALRWVQSNVKAFGGDPHRVTLLGQSSGGTAILGLLASSVSRGLFSAAISLSASPNITVDIVSAQATFRTPVLNTCGLSANTTSATILDCLQRLSPQEVATLLPKGFNVEPKLPQSPGGQQYLGLPVVDGVTIEVPALKALQRGVVDVPLILQTMLAEMDTYEGNTTIYNMSPTSYNQFLAQHFRSKGWTSAEEAARQLAVMYASEQANSTELAYQVFLADFSFLCGHLHLASAASGSFSSPVYLSVGVQAPSAPMPVMPGRPPCRHAGHNFDYIAATRAWDFWYQHFPPTPAYHATASDIAFGNSLWTQWYNLAANGHAAPAARFDDDVVPGRYVVNLQAEAVTHVVNYSARRCVTLEAAPLGLREAFWLVN